MLNVEELTLYLSITRLNSTYIDGTHLYDEILNHMLQLNKFIFSINTLVINKNIRINLPSNNDIQLSFIRKGNQQIDSYIHNESVKRGSTCHIYSIPYQFGNFFDVNCHFQGGIFNQVRCVIMADREHPFQQEFFQVISNSFPFLQTLIICNYQPQKRKELFSTITFPHLRNLGLRRAHVDYAAQFLSDTKIHLPYLLELIITYESLSTVTNNFINHETRLTCTRVETLLLYGSYIRSQNLHTYFPSCSF